MAINLDPARRCMLLERGVAEIYNDIPMSAPVQRIMLIGKGAGMASKSSEGIRQMLKETGFIEALHAEARSRSTGEVPLPPALHTEFKPAERETERV